VLKGEVRALATKISKKEFHSVLRRDCTASKIDFSQNHQYVGRLAGRNPSSPPPFYDEYVFFLQN
jgi:hypothetical protein